MDPVEFAIHLTESRPMSQIKMIQDEQNTRFGQGMAMKQFGQRQYEFDVTKQLQQQQMELYRQKTMADIANMNFKQQMMKAQFEHQKNMWNQQTAMLNAAPRLNQLIATTDYNSENSYKDFMEKAASDPYLRMLDPTHLMAAYTQGNQANLQTNMGQMQLANRNRQISMANTIANLGGNPADFMDGDGSVDMEAGMDFLRQKTGRDDIMLGVGGTGSGRTGYGSGLQFGFGGQTQKERDTAINQKQQRINQLYGAKIKAEKEGNADTANEIKEEIDSLKEELLEQKSPGYASSKRMISSGGNNNISVSGGFLDNAEEGVPSDYGDEGNYTETQPESKNPAASSWISNFNPDVY